MFTYFVVVVVVAVIVLKVVINKNALAEIFSKIIQMREEEEKKTNVKTW